MKTHTLPGLSMPLDDSWDVLVLGGGPAGVAAAIGAAREGSRTLLVENTGCLGGMGTAALVPAWAPYSDLTDNVVYRGLAEKFFRESNKHVPHLKPGTLDWAPLSHEDLKQIYDREVSGSGARVLFHTRLAHVEAADGQVRSVIVANKAGLSALRAKVYIDATGDADLCAWAGAEFLSDGGAPMPATLCFVLANVDTYAYLHGPELHPGNRHSPVYQIVNSGRYPLIPDLHLCSNLIGPDTVGFNAGHLWVDGTDPLAVSDVMMQGRQIARSFRDALAEFFPAAFASAYLANTGNLLGVRESRRVAGDYTLTLDDYLARRKFPDEISRNSYFLDTHFAKGQAVSKPEELWAWDSTTLRYKAGETHGVPYRCLTPKSLRNALVAGRCLSCDQRVQSTVRIMPVCFTTGEAAGVAAHQAIADADSDVHRVDTNKLRRRLVEHGAWLP